MNLQLISSKAGEKERQDMTHVRLALTVFTVCAAALLSFGCASKDHQRQNPVVPQETGRARQAMWFGQTTTVFGDDGLGINAVDVDLASVVWGQTSAGAGSGDIVQFDDGTRWVVAVAIQGDPGLTTPWLRFLDQNGNAQPGEFQVTAGIPVIGKCRFPRVDCSYRGNGNLVVYVAYRTGTDGSEWPQISTWDVHVVRMHFTYSSSTWSYASQSLIGATPMALTGIGETHPDIAIDQASEDVYVAWTFIMGPVDLKYSRYDYADHVWTPPAYLEGPNGCDPWGQNDAWFVSLDVGRVAGLPGGGTPRLVGFAYTGAFKAYSPYWGCRAIVGWFNTGVDGNHPPAVLLQTPGFEAGTNGLRNESGLIHVDIPRDNATSNGAAVVYVQDVTPINGLINTYRIYGISSLNYGLPASYVWISNPQTLAFDTATWPSLAVHNDTGNTASATYFARDNDDIPPGPWITYATYWDLANASVSASDPTPVDWGAQGTFILEVASLLTYNWGTASSLVDISLNENQYWAAWSDTMGGAVNPHAVRGAVGFANH